MNLHSQCQCGTTKIAVKAQPIIRGYCHCLTCQEFNQAPYADVAIFYADDVAMPSKEQVEFHNFSNSALAVPRGKCRQCGMPSIEKMKIPGMKPMVLIPAGNFSEPSALPAPDLHMFYHRRVADIEDSLPKYSGLLPSQLGFVSRLVKALLSYKRKAEHLRASPPA